MIAATASANGHGLEVRTLDGVLSIMTLRRTSGMKTVSAREANQQFSRLLGRVADGEEIVITRRGQPVATLSPYRGRTMTAERKAAVERMLALMERGFPMGGIRATRDEMHER